MRRAFLMMALLAAAAAGVVAQQGQAEIDLQAAIRTETVDGNLSGAIKRYGEVAATHIGNRAVAAKALIRMAECYQKLGDAQARAVYERVLREYPDQAEAAATARHRLAAEPPPFEKGDRRVWSGPRVDMFGQVSPDGRYITFVDWGGDQNLKVHDIVTNTDRPLTTTGPSIGFSEFAEFSTISRDGRFVAYAWYNDKGRYDLRLLPLHGAAVSQPKVIFPDDDDIRSIAPLDWSPDARSIAVRIRRQDGTGQIGLVQPQAGTLRVLKSIDWRGAEKIMFSPDGRFIAYDLPTSETDTARSVYVMAVDGSREAAVVDHPSRNAFMAWSLDGRFVIFSSDRVGNNALWAQAISDGRPHGRPFVIKQDVGSVFSLGLSKSGALYAFKLAGVRSVQVAPLDLMAPRVPLSQPATFQRYIPSGGNPSWSRDGKSFSYMSCGGSSRPICSLSIVSVETGQTRELYPKMSYLGGPRWSADGRSFLTDGSDLKGRRALYRIDAQTGEITHVHDRLGAITQWAPDEKKFYYRVGGSIVERDIVSGADRQIFRERAKGNSVSIKVSPDGRRIAAVETAGAVDTLYLISISDGAATEVLRAKAGERFNGFGLEWTPDNAGVLLPRRSDADPPEWWFVRLDSSHAVRKLEVDTQNWAFGAGGLAIHPNGKQIAFTAHAGTQGAEVWALENVFPSVAKP